MGGGPRRKLLVEASTPDEAKNKWCCECGCVNYTPEDRPCTDCGKVWSLAPGEGRWTCFVCDCLESTLANDCGSCGASRGARDNPLPSPRAGPLGRRAPRLPVPRHVIYIDSGDGGRPSYQVVAVLATLILVSHFLPTDHFDGVWTSADCRLRLWQSTSTPNFGQLAPVAGDVHPNSAYPACVLVKTVSTNTTARPNPRSSSYLWRVVK